MNGRYCCAINEEKPNGGSPSEIESGLCDGHGFDFESTCCKDNKFTKCPGVSCVDNSAG